MNKFAKLTACLTTPSYRAALLRHLVAAAAEHETALGALSCRTVVDIGANRGQFALVARRCFPGARIISFEPLQVPAARFARVFSGDPNTYLHVVAVGSPQDRATMYVSRKDDSSSLLPIGARQREVFPGTAQAGVAEVRVDTLDQLVTAEDIASPALLKLDVQGYELHALKACESLLNRFAYVYVECSFVELYTGQALAHEVVAWLETRGFRLSSTHNMTRDAAGREVQADFLFKANRA